MKEVPISKYVSIQTNKIFFARDKKNPFALEFHIRVKDPDFDVFVKKSARNPRKAFRFKENRAGGFKSKDREGLFDIGFRIIDLLELLDNRRHLSPGEIPREDFFNNMPFGFVVKFKEESSVEQFFDSLQTYLKKYIPPLEKQYEEYKKRMEHEERQYQLKLEKAKSNGFDIK
ncbi:hypothetical protein MOD71_18630 [Bacillus haynesii]|uniref:hypothetical protein n=1 Tax=Bacillus haynesii TaxID=1925021 RepID=UPI0022819B85|nr:hypothetical protein [Bacillus haynesii]MCY8737523.1 hypothetical protein [Bacillus haynesii]